MRIAICDENCIFRHELRSYIVEYKKNKRIQVDIYEFENGKDFLSSELFFDLIFLGYQLPDTNGMQIARELRSRNIPCDIVFITEHPEFVYEAFEVNAYRFFTKPIKREEVISMLDLYLTHKKSLSPISVHIDGEKRTIHLKDIIYLEGDGKHCIIRTKTDTLRSSKTISEVSKRLPRQYFFRIHKSYVINMHYIASSDSKHITFTNGEKAMISRNRLSEFKQTYDEFLEKYYTKV